MYFLFGVQAAVAKAAGWVAMSCDIPLLAVVYLAATDPGLDGFLISLVIGFLADAFIPGGLLGMQMEVLGIAFLIARGLAERLHVVRPLPLMVVVLVCLVVKTLLVFVFSVVFDREFTQYSALFLNALPQAATTVLLAPVFISVLRWVERKLTRRRVGWTPSR